MLAGNEKSRTTARTTAMLSARMDDGAATYDVRVGDLSSRGMLVVSDHPPQRGAIVDISVAGHHVVGQVRWLSGRRFGVRSRENIDVRAIMAGLPPQRRMAAKKISQSNDPDDWSRQKLYVSYGVLGVTAFATAYLIANYFVL